MYTNKVMLMQLYCEHPGPGYTHAAAILVNMQDQVILRQLCCNHTEPGYPHANILSTCGIKLHSCSYTVKIQNNGTVSTATAVVTVQLPAGGAAQAFWQKTYPPEGSKAGPYKA